MSFHLKPRLFAALLTVFVFGFASHVAAQTQDGFALNRFEPSERGSEWFVMDSLDFRGHMRPAMGVVGEWGYRPLVLYNGDGSVRNEIVKHQVFAHLGASLVLWERLRLAVNLPVAVYQAGESATVGAATFNEPSSSAGVGDLRLGADFRLFGRHGDAITATVGSQVFLPTGSADAYTGDGSFRLAPRIMVAGDVGHFTYSSKVGFQYRGNPGSFANGQLGSELLIGGAAGLRLADGKLVLGPEVFGSTVVTDGAAFSKASTPLEGIFGAHYTLGEHWRLGAGLGAGLTRGFGTPTMRGLVSLEWVTPGERKDRDHDGVEDDDDACPDVAGVRTADEKTNGCPPPPDGDHDGIIDAVDACPTVAGIVSNDPTQHGCPPDRDKDTILDGEDACPDVIGIRHMDSERNGCPADGDNDGIIDTEDACPDVPGLWSEDVKLRGCPDGDKDHDGVLDSMDACPCHVGPGANDARRSGCPQARVVEQRVVTLDQVKFKLGAAVIDPSPESLGVLEAVLKVMQEHPEIARLRVEGHSDSSGKASQNRRLSRKRAESVVAWLVGHGIQKKRLTSEGFGPDRPLAPNDTEEGRRANRRVELHIESQSPILERSQASSVSEDVCAKAKAKTGADAEPPSEIRGTVRSLQGKAIGATVRIEPSNVSVTTDGIGFFSMPVIPGNYKVIIEASGTMTQQRQVVVEKDGVTYLNVTLKPAR